MAFAVPISVKVLIIIDSGLDIPTVIKSKFFWIIMSTLTNCIKRQKVYKKLEWDQKQGQTNVKDRAQSSRSKILLNELMSSKKEIQNREPNDVLDSILFAKCITYNINK